MSVDVPLLRKYVEWVEEQETLTKGREWLQADWVTGTSQWARDDLEGVDFCDTAFCFAGKVVVDAGWRPIPIGEGEYSARVRKGSEERLVEELACELLGITKNDRNWGSPLFAPSNKAADIRRIAEDIAGERL